MGEAKRRKVSDPSFGNSMRGLVVCPRMHINGSHVSLGSQLDPQELRCALLFWDKLVWPSSRAIYIASGPDEQFLENVSVLTRPDYTFNGDAAQGMARTQVAAFLDLDQKHPGQWSLAQGENTLWLKDSVLEPNQGVLLELLNAIPVPDKDIPLAEVLEFKRLRHDELELLRNELDGFVAAVNQAEDKAAELAKHICSIDSACADVLKVSREWQFPVKLTDLKTSVEFRPFVTMLGGVAAFGLGTNAGLTASAAVLAGVGGAAAATAPALKLSADFGWRGLKRRFGPYRYVYKFHNSLF